MTKPRKLTATQSKKLDSIKTVSDKIRYLNGQKFTRMQISQVLGKRYQHVRNVLVQDEEREIVRRHREQQKSQS